MLRHLSIRDFVIVAALDLEFDSGFTVFSGETGAGKSILIDALALALGARADASVVRNGEARADITAEFDTHPDVDAWLDEQALAAIETEHGNTVMLRRVVDGNGRSRAFINGTAATLTQLRELGEMFVDIHGQHAHQLLMRPDAQRELFDTHAGLLDTKAAVTRAWRTWRDAAQAVETAQSKDRELQLERERLAWQLAELDKLSPQPGEWEEVNVEHRRLSHSANLIDGVQAALSALSESDEAMLGHLSSVISKVRDLAEIDPALNDALAALEPAEIQLQEAAYSLSHYAQRLELDPDRLTQVEKRLDALHSAARKFRLQPETLPQEHEERREQLAKLDAAADLDALRAAEAKAKDAYLADAKVLSKARAKAAKALGAAVTTGMQELSMAGGSFEVALVPLPDGGAHGMEQIEFRVAGHAGVPLRPLAKVASGGELARISLALSVIASAASPTPTLIFDEVDTGIGGGVAEVVGRLLHQLGEQRQVLCVTHLPQVAARGDHHFQVAKSSKGKNGTVSTVTSLDKTSRIEEVARMLGGLAITATTRKHAKEMLTTA
ncbi:DNA repair protein RecN [Paraburkholderia hospita]|jgi:DNA repair protein RecN (Recombination protein N)|uniref:DNA repair protein RecN n=1 Tax=Paraburkholderia hospita TaxID=169430 RepID=A0ABN0FTK3_9BURK|nr:DNA repair protein RecN [Paraburkholderia hospita]EUC14524.1 DNA repair protein RecN [Burkholderia sp. BT03]EIN02102.1 DNA repair protein RecN [Paraburkholderia hospita]OUL92873.1 DNA repair protein RecN [Paraburkholderia hospita]OUL93748.1 DNA repair protein RecN [Paraburkholderia hospita]OUL94806.1 DNA repair protein RecN [Paraburkholderia hospita]